MSDDVDAVDVFIAEANEHLTLLEEVLMEMEEHPTDQELIDQAFRSMHTIKGSGAMFGFDDLSAFTHHLETAFDKVRNGEFLISPELISVILDSKDHIESLLEDTKQTTGQTITGNALLTRLQDIIPNESAPVDTSPAVAVKPMPSQQQLDQTIRIRVKPTASAFEDGFDAMPILRELTALGACNISTSFDDLPALSELNPETCLLRWNILLTTSEGINAIEDIFIFVRDEWDIDIEPIEMDFLDEDEQTNQIGTILIDRGDISLTEIEKTLSEQPKTGEILQQAGLVSAEQIDAALTEQQIIRENKEKSQTKEKQTNVRVPTSKLDSLMDLVGELVIVQARLDQLNQEREDESLANISEDLNQLTTELRDNTLDIRMLPIGTTFSRFRRLVRDLSRDLGKEIQLITEGADTELDKMVIDSLADPMVHLIRNSVDHGIEKPDVREALGKPHKGTIHLSAEHAEGQVIVRIRDDGGSMNATKLKAKAIEKGVILADQKMSNEECYNLIFAAGFSTAEAVTDISGRGVGMDVVKRSIQALRGDVKIDCDPGVSTTITISLPITLAIIEGLMVSVSDERYILPLNNIEECIEISRADSGDYPDKRLVEIRGELVPFVRLREWFDVKGQSPDIEQIIITRVGDNDFGFCVDEVIGQYQAVIKSLGKFYGDVKGLAGATILGDGGVAMVLDIARLTAAIEDETSTRH